MRRFIAILGAALMVATACGQTSPTGTATSAAPSEKPVPGGRLVDGSTSDPKTMQPVISTDTASSNVWGNFYPTLLRSDPDTGDLQPGLAEKFELSKDGLTVTYTLRDGLVWSDGEKFTGNDFKYTVEAIARSKKTVRKSTFQDIAGWADYRDGKTDTLAGLTVSPDGKVITIQLTKVFCPALRNLATYSLPQHSFVKVWDNKSTDVTKNIDDNPLNMAPPASMGPWVFKSFTPGVQVSMVANEKYWRGRPLIDEYVIKTYADSQATKAALLAGELSYGGVAAQDTDEVKKNENLVFYRFPGQTVYENLGWNAAAAKAPWLRSKDVRQALWYGLPVKQIIDKVLFGYAQPAYTHTPPSSWAYDGAGLNHYDYDVAKAKSLLEKAGAKMGPNGVYLWTDGQPMRMRLEGDQSSTTRKQIIEVATESYKQIGIQIDPLLESFNALLDRTDPGTDFEGYDLGWSLGLDPDGMYSIWHSSQRGKGQFNNVDFNNPEADKLLEVGRNGPDCSTAARKAAYVRVNQILNDEAYYTFLYLPDSRIFFNKSVRGIEPKVYSTGSGWNIEKWWIKQ